MRIALRLAPALLWVLVAVAASGCAGWTALQQSPSGGGETASAAQLEAERSEAAAEAYRRAEEEKVRALEGEVRRLRADLQRAEQALVAAESGLRSSHSRADAVSMLAEARIHVERAARAAPWRPAEIAEARAKLDEADGKVRAGYFGSAMFFVYRAQRIAVQLENEATAVRRTPGARFVLARRANLRMEPTTESGVLDVLTRGAPVFAESAHAGWFLVRTPTGAVGWIYAELVSEPTTTQSLPASFAR